MISRERIEHIRRNRAADGFITGLEATDLFAAIDERDELLTKAREVIASGTSYEEADMMLRIADFLRGGRFEVKP